LRANSIYLHPQSLTTSLKIHSQTSGTSSPESFAITFINSFLVIPSSRRYSSGVSDLSVIKPFEAR